jgi:hypothetical protein
MALSAIEQEEEENESRVISIVGSHSHHKQQSFVEQGGHSQLKFANMASSNNSSNMSASDRSDFLQTRQSVDDIALGLSSDHRSSVNDEDKYGRFL